MTAFWKRNRDDDDDDDMSGDFFSPLLLRILHFCFCCLIETPAPTLLLTFRNIKATPCEDKLYSQWIRLTISLALYLEFWIEMAIYQKPVARAYRREAICTCT